MQTGQFCNNCTAFKQYKLLNEKLLLCWLYNQIKLRNNTDKMGNAPGIPVDENPFPRKIPNEH